MKITIETTVAAPIEQVWDAWVSPDAIMQWNTPSDDWHTTSATVDLQEGGTFTSRMEAKDGNMGFDFGGTYTKIIPHQLIEYVMDDDRTVQIAFIPSEQGVIVRETFDTEDQNEAEMQRAGWQAILDNFNAYVMAAQ